MSWTSFPLLWSYGNVSRFCSPRKRERPGELQLPGRAFLRLYGIIFLVSSDEPAGPHGRTSSSRHADCLMGLGQGAPTWRKSPVEVRQAGCSTRERRVCKRRKSCNVLLSAGNRFGF